ncbi:MAG: TAXI family TRAP transporter solute-binding subunit [Mycobacteriaceae bacterium]|nr:TAXI family TRAP transporter solute-binding subunit [Mycobacteriaceae bacterium]
MDRRRFLGVAGAVAGIGAGVGLGAAGGLLGGDPVPVRLGAGRPGGMFHDFALLLAEVAASADTLRIEPVATDGSRANLKLLGDGKIDAALTLADAAAISDVPIRAIGRLYESYIQLAVRADSPVRTTADLRGHRVDLGVVGSGAAMTAERLLRAADLNPELDTVVSHRPLAAAIQTLLSGGVDAIIWGDGLPTPELDAPRRTRLIDTGCLAPALQRQFQFRYDSMTIPADAYPAHPTVSTIGVPNLLVGTPAMAHRTAAALTDLLLRRSADLMPDQALGFQFLTRRWLIVTGTLPLHPGAADSYREFHG